MKMLVEIADSKAASFKELIKQHSYVKAKTISEPNAAILEEILHIKKPLKILKR